MNWLSTIFTGMLVSGSVGSTGQIIYVNYAPAATAEQADGFSRIGFFENNPVGWFVNTPMRVSDCGSKDLDCMRIGGLILAKPKRLPRIGQEWKAQGRAFKTIASTTVWVNGQNRPALVVESSGRGPYRYLLNERLGIVGIILHSQREDEPGEAYLLAGNCGLFCGGVDDRIAICRSSI